MTSEVEKPKPQGLTDAQLVESVRQRAGVPQGTPGPSDANIVAGVRGFAREFTYWYDRVLEEAIPEYRKLIINRVNPMIRSMELIGKSSEEVADALVGDYARRNFVTAGGWALEKLAIEAGPSLEKSSAVGMDAERREFGPRPTTHLYVIKSGLVTRNSDILKALKSNGQEAEKRLKQTDRKAVVRVVYAILAGRRQSNFEAGVDRPSSAEFWAEVLELEDEVQAADMAVAMAQEAGWLLQGEGSAGHLAQLKHAVAVYLGTDSDAGEVDWEFIAQRNMREAKTTDEADKRRHERVKKTVDPSGTIWKSRRKNSDSGQASLLADVAAAGGPENAEALAKMLPGT